MKLTPLLVGILPAAVVLAAPSPSTQGTPGPLPENVRLAMLFGNSGAEAEQLTTGSAADGRASMEAATWIAYCEDRNYGGRCATQNPVAGACYPVAPILNNRFSTPPLTHPLCS